MTDISKPLGVEGSPALDQKAFAEALGVATWLMTLDETHKARPISWLEEAVLPGLLLKQYKILRKPDETPFAFVAWATASDEALQRYAASEKFDSPLDWRSGGHPVVVACISPIIPEATLRDRVLEELRAAQDAAKSRAAEEQTK